MIRYTFKDDAPLTIKGARDANAQIIGEALATIAEAKDGHLEPEAVVEAAADPAHALHRHFEWDDAKAAAAHRLDQARALIRVVRLADESTESGTVRAFISVSDRGVSYRTAGDVKADQRLQTIILQRAEKDLLAWEARYRDIEDICQMVRDARERLSRKREDVAAQTNAPH